MGLQKFPASPCNSYCLGCMIQANHVLSDSNFCRGPAGDFCRKILACRAAFENHSLHQVQSSLFLISTRAPEGNEATFIKPTLVIRRAKRRRAAPLIHPTASEKKKKTLHIRNTGHPDLLQESGIWNGQSNSTDVECASHLD